MPPAAERCWTVCGRSRGRARCCGRAALGRWLRMLRASLPFLRVLAQAPAGGQQGRGGGSWRGPLERLEGGYRSATVMMPCDVGLLPPPDPQLGCRALSCPAAPAGAVSGTRGCLRGVRRFPGGKSTAQMLRVINIYSAKIITAGRQQIAVNGRGGQSPSLARSSAGPGAWGSPGAPAPPGGAASCPAAFSEHRCLPFRSPHCSASRAEPGLTHALGSTAGAGCQLCLGEDPSAALIKSGEVDSDPVMYSPGKVTRPCLITVLCLESFPASLADIYLDFTQGLLISSLA